MAKPLIGYCGAYCASCAIFIASTTSNKRKKADLARRLSNESGKEVGLEDIVCWGCRAASNKSWSRDCRLKKCASDKGIEFCYQCEEFPCKDLQAYFDKHPQARANLKRISKIGVDAFLSEMMRGADGNG